jgi:hypothetical protein
MPFPDPAENAIVLSAVKHERDRQEDSVRFRCELYSEHTADYQRVYQAAEIKPRRAATC